MKFSISSTDLLKELQKASGAIGNNPVIAILEDFLFVVENDVLTIAATDLETSIVTSIDVMSDEDGRIAIPGKTLLETLKALPEQPITFAINTDTKSIEITSAFGKYRLAGDDADDFPEIPTPDSVESITVDATMIHQAINKTAFATTNDELRLAMTGVNVVIDFNKIIFIATDAHKLVKYTFNDVNCDTTTSFILPRKALSMLRNALPANGELLISYNSSNAFFELDKTKVACRLVDAKYPDVMGIIPQINPFTLQVNKKDFLSSLKRIIIYANKTSNQITLNLDQDSLTINTQDLDFSNEANEQLSCQYDGDPIKIAFNAKFLIEILSVIDADEIEIKLADASKAGVITPSEQIEGEDLMMLIMPVMLNY